MDTYLSQTKKTRLTHGLIRMVAQVLIIFTRDNRRELLKSILRIFAKEDGAFFVNRNLAHHQALTFPMHRWGRQLCLYTSNPDRPYRHLRFLRWTISLVHWFPLCGRVGRTCSLLLPRSRLLLNVDHCPPVFHFCIRRTKKELDKNY